ncbi:hypothetical protein [Aeromonas salmonicida]|uniref:hypothetical protein n=1 Tax=Aeromonas salmonicida TaxID=645 RepID=UPI00223F5919|nr:hypothetical protein [Aeromonas salmonicida]
MSSYKWNEREAFYLYNALIVNEFVFPFVKCRDTRVVSLIDMKSELDVLVSNIVSDTRGLKGLFSKLMRSQCMEFDEAGLDTPSSVKAYMSALYNKVVASSKDLSLLLKDKRARRYTFASMRVAIHSYDQPSCNEIFGGAFFSDVRNGLFRDAYSGEVEQPFRPT